MADKSVKELANFVGRPVSTVLEQLAAAGVSARGENDVLSDADQEKLVGFLRRSHGQNHRDDNPQITLKRKTLTTAQVASSSGRQKTIQVEVRKKHTFVKPDPVALAAEKERAQTEATEQALRAQAAAEKAKLQAEQAKAAAALALAEKQAKAAEKAEAKKANEKKEAKKRPVVKEESSEERITREKEKARLKMAEEAARREAAEQTQVKIVEQMRQMASKYADSDNVPTTVVEVDAAPLAEGLVGDAYEESFAKEDRDIKRGGTTGTAKIGKGVSRNRREEGIEERDFRQPHRALKVSQNRHGFAKPVERQVYDVQIGGSVIVSDLAAKMAVKVKEVIKTLMKMGEMVTQNQTIDQDTASLVVEEMGHNPVLVSETAAEDKLRAAAQSSGGVAATRPPVVTVMGHVDHGKTSLLDSIRKAKVASGEAGGITQHIGAYHVDTPRGMITFLDTPGHAAFSSMRSRGAKVTDIVIIVVAADDGVMPQTIEAINHAKAANTPIIIAINKMDKENADPDRVLTELSIQGITTELWGGDTAVAKISAHSGAGIDELLDMISLQAEIMELQAPNDGNAQGVVIESRIEKGRGVVASVLVQKGLLKVGDLVLAGSVYGRVRAMHDEDGQRIQIAGPSIPVEILGLPDTPNAGDDVLVVSDEKKAREVASFRADKERRIKLDRQNDMRLENIMASMGKQDTPVVNLVLKTDVKGSLEALSQALMDLSTEDVSVRIVGSGVGAITESDVTLAESASAVLLGFNVRADNAARAKCDEDGIDIRYYSVLYQMIDDVKAAMSGLLAPEHREKILGTAEVRQVFRSSRFGAAAGCMVLEGSLQRNKPIRVLRAGVVVFQGELESLRRFKDDVADVRNGMECGLGVKGYNDIAEGDQVECFDIQVIVRSL